MKPYDGAVNNPITECDNCGITLPVDETDSCIKCGDTLCPNCICESCENEADDEEENDE